MCLSDVVSFNLPVCVKKMPPAADKRVAVTTIKIIRDTKLLRFMLNIAIT